MLGTKISGTTSALPIHEAVEVVTSGECEDFSISARKAAGS
jgi:hypothetical protein